MTKIVMAVYLYCFSKTVNIPNMCRPKQSLIVQKKREPLPRLVWLIGLNTGLQTKRLPD